VITAAGTAGISISVISSMLSRWFERLRVFVSGIAISGTALGQFLFIPLIALLLETFGWRWTWSILGMLLSVLIIPISLFVIRSNPARDGAASPKSPMRAETVSGELSSAPNSSGVAPILLSRNFLLLGASYFICGFQDFLFVTQMIPFVTDWGFSMQEASNLQGWAGLLSVPGVLIFSAASEKLGRRLPLFLTFVPRVICFFLLVFADGPRTVYAAALLFGFTLMASAPLGAAIVAELYGLRHVGTLTGVIFWVHHLGGALGAYVGGITYDLTGSYSAAFAAALALAVVALLTSATIDRPRTGTRE
jgi:MFS family permease